MGFATGGYPSKDNKALEARISTLERMLGSVRLLPVTTADESFDLLGRKLGPGKAPHAFRINLVGDDYSLSFGSIRDGTNGEAVDIKAIVAPEGGDAVTHRASAGYVVIEADVAEEDLSLGGWSVNISDEANEVGISGARQDKLRLVLGKLVASGGGLVVRQSTFTSQVATHGFMSGVPVRVFESAPTVH